MSAELTLYIPGLLGPLAGLEGVPAKEWPRLPTLEAFLSRAEHSVLPSTGGEAVLFALFPLQAGAGDPPVAALTRIYDGCMPDEAWWIRADPVYLHADPDRMLLLAHGDLGLSRDEAVALTATLAEHLAEDGWRLEMGAPERWYLCVPEPPALTTHSPDAALNQDIAGRLPEGPDGARWRRIMNEVQMLLHAHPVNAEREARGLPVVNSVWFWGGGRVPQVGPRTWAGVWADSVLPRALGLQAGSPDAGLPPDPEAWMRALAPGRHLAVVESLRPPLRERDAVNWFSALETLERDWFIPAGEALRAGRLTSVRLVTDAGDDFRIGRGRFRHWWKRRRPLRDILKGRA